MNRAVLSTEIFVATYDDELFFRRWGGSGLPVVLLHGFIANSKWNWIAAGIVDALTGRSGRCRADARGTAGPGSHRSRDDDLSAANAIPDTSSAIVAGDHFDAVDQLDLSGPSPPTSPTSEI